MNNNEINQGEIYLVKNKTNGKKYVGQAMKYVSKNKNKWGTIGRWKSHIREALSGKKDHCLLLNQAIRKYGKKNFTIYKLCDCHLDNINQLEIEYIKKHNTLSPNGYNLKTGGSNGKDSLLTKQKKSNSRKGLKHSESTKQNISKGQLGNRRNKIKRKYKEDNNLPKYICCVRRNEKKIAYIVKAFPIGINKKEYINKQFNNSENPELALQDALKYLEELKKKYGYVEEEIEDKKNKKEMKQAQEKMEKKITKKLPKDIYPILKENKVIGYKVKGLIDNNENEIPERDFIKCTNRWNLDQAKKFIEQIKFINENNIEVKDWNKINIKSKKKTKNNSSNLYLPKYINVVRSKGEEIGYCINGLMILDDNGNKKKYYRKFTAKSLTMEEKYKLAINHLEEKNKSKII